MIGENLLQDPLAPDIEKRIPDVLAPKTGDERDARLCKHV
jgi:hypothetical protein